MKIPLLHHFKASRRAALSLTLLSFAGLFWTSRFLEAQDSATAKPSDPGFEKQAKPFLAKNCVRCHNANMAMSGIRVDQLDGAFEDRHIRLWEEIRKRVSEGTMPPKGQPQPDIAARSEMTDWISHGIESARLRPTPKNGLVRRLTVAQYRNTLRELLQLDDDLTETLPPEAVSVDGFVNNRETLQLSPMLVESYFEIAEEALNRAIIDPATKPAIETFRMEFGKSVNKQPLEPLILGANSLLLDNADFVVTQPVPRRPFAFTPFAMRTKYRFIEGYAGNDTVRGWRDYDSIYHSVFACLRGITGYPKGEAYSSVPEGLLLRPAIPSDELFSGEGTYGPRANFKISLRELPDNGRFRVTVTAAKYNDGLLLDEKASPQPKENAAALVWNNPEKPQTLTVKKPGIYQVDVYLGSSRQPPTAAPDASKLSEHLSASWPMEDKPAAGARWEGDAHLAESPFGKALSLDGYGDSLVVPRNDSVNVGTGDFTVSAWIYPREKRKAGIVSLNRGYGWYLDMPDNRGILRLGTTREDSLSNGVLSSPPGMLQANTWQHIAAVVRRGQESRLYINGYPVAKGKIGNANLDNPKADLYIGRLPGAQQFRGEMDELKLYRRALDESEIQALIQPGRQFVQAPGPEPSQYVTVTAGNRQFSGNVKQPAFLAVRLNAGPLPLSLEHRGVTPLDRLVFTPIEENSELAERFEVFEKRLPRLGVYLGLRRDCGSTLARVGPVQTVKGTHLSRYVFEGAIRNFPSPEVEKDNVNYLAGIRELGVRSEYTDGRDMPRLLIKSVEFEGPFYESWPPASHRSIFPNSPKSSDQLAYGREILRSFAARAYRRPITSTEEEAMFAVFKNSLSQTGDFRESVKVTLRVVLTSPQFLFLTETSQTPAPEPLTDYELASKLSYFLWNGPPDPITLKLAAAGTLKQQLNSEVARMVADPRFSQFTREFVSQWLALDKFSVLEPDRKRFPKLTRDTRTELRQEPIEFVQYLVRNNLPVRNLIDSDFVMANEVVANYYDAGDKTESGFQFVPIKRQTTELGGVLTQPAIMAGLSDGRESNPVKRGSWLARRIIAEPPDPPPPNVPALKEETANLTLRQRLEQHRDQPGCRQCHAKIDPWGVALEQFDAGGRLKTTPTDARSTLPDKTEVDGIQALKHYLGDDHIDKVAFSVLKHLATYGNGRTLTYNELHVLKNDQSKLKANGYRMQDMVQFVVQSKMFLEK